MDLSSELNSCLSGNDAITLLELIHESLSCKMKEDFVSLFPKLQELLDCDYAIAALGYHDQAKGVVITDRINISFPEQWCLEYKAKDYLKSDLVVNGNFTSYKLQCWSEVKKNLVNAESQKKIASLCRDFGMKDGYTFGSRPTPPGKQGSMFCFSGSSMKKERRSELILECIVPHLHPALSHICKKLPATDKKIVLSDREKEVLNWLKRGKSSWDISVILGVSESTANFHIYKIMQKLDVVNRPQAVAAAARLGLIDFF